MSLRAFYHYFLAISVLFSSSFAVFHGSEHIPTEYTGSLLNSITHDHSEHHSHDTKKPNFQLSNTETPKKNHHIESLCEACLVFSNLFAYGLDTQNSYFLVGKFYYFPTSSSHDKQHTHTAYLSRAPPLMV